MRWVMPFMEINSLQSGSFPDDSRFTLVWNGTQLLLSPGENRFRFTSSELTFPSDTPIAVHTLAEGEFLLSVETDTIPVAGCEWVGLRHLLGVLTVEVFKQACTAVQNAHWLKSHRYCGVCGVPTKLSDSDTCLECPHCNTQYFPRIAPCVIGLVTRGDECVLARGEKHPPGMFSTLAGFIELSESAEEAFAREVEEEVGIKIKNIRYLGSQHWPFPAQLMLGFEAEYASGELTIDEVEIVEARWFSKTDLPLIPPESTISGKIIKNFLERKA